MNVSADPPKTEERGRLVRLLDRFAAIGNALPDPVTLFLILCAVVIGASAVFAGVSEDIVQRDGTVKATTVQSLLSTGGLRWMFENAVANFVGFAPLGKVLVVMLGIGVAERSGLVAMALRVIVQGVPKPLVTAAVVFAGVMSSMAADAGYVVLTPLGAVLFAGLGRHPLAGLAAAFAGVSGGFSANLLITGLDPMLAGLSQEAARVIDPAYTVNAAANYYFMVASTLLITAVGTLVTSRLVEPMLGQWDPSKAEDAPRAPEQPSADERAAFRAAMAAGFVVFVGVLALAFVPASPLRAPVPAGQPAVAALNPFFHSIEVLIAILFLVPGVVYGVRAGKVKSDKDVAKMTNDTMATMGAYIVLAFAAAQFVAFFNWTNLGAITAVNGAELLRSIGLTGIPLLLAFLVVSALMNLFVGSASAKWAFMAPIFVPMLMQMGYSPETVQATYRVGDSITNIITPLLPYVPVIIIFARRYDREAGLGTLIASMLPYSIAFGVAWTLMLTGWIGLELPLGPGAPIHYSAGTPASP
ncbi:MAG: AbgT family transporter [Myxococcales bacterium]|nr:AbgT family transporter [Myxococcales bacterium]